MAANSAKEIWFAVIPARTDIIVSDRGNRTISALVTTPVKGARAAEGIWYAAILVTKPGVALARAKKAIFVQKKRPTRAAGTAVDDWFVVVPIWAITNASTDKAPLDIACRLCEAR
ncbi:MAG: hypothetical protein Q7T83_08050 [Thermodesulfovibrionales bacterium]|nr:hypothetical protein [Thermodesulfovibrionales bacterium]